LFYCIFEFQRIPLSKLFLIWFIGGMWITPCGYDYNGTKEKHCFIGSSNLNVFH